MDADHFKSLMQIIAKNDQEIEQGKEWMCRAGNGGIQAFSQTLHHDLQSPDISTNLTAHFALIGLRTTMESAMNQEQERDQE